MRRVAARNNSVEAGSTSKQVDLDFENFPYAPNDELKCSNFSNGEIVRGKFIKLNKDRSKFCIHDTNLKKLRWLSFADFSLERDV